MHYRTRLRRATSGAAAVLLLGMVASCTLSVDTSEAIYSCNEISECPLGQNCVAGLCQAEGAAGLDVAGDTPNPNPPSPGCVVAPSSCEVDLCIPNTMCVVTIDGALDEFDNAPTAMFQPALGGNQVQARMLWDPEALYFAYSITDSELVGSETVRDGLVWEDDSIEWFVDRLNDGGVSPTGRYMRSDDFQGIINLLNTHFDKQGNDANPSDGSATWNTNEWTSAVRLVGSRNNNSDVDTGMSVEVRIPWSILGFIVPPIPDQKIGVGLAHNDSDANERSGVMWPNLSSNFQNAFNWRPVRLVLTAQ